MARFFSFTPEASRASGSTAYRVVGRSIALRAETPAVPSRVSKNLCVAWGEVATTIGPFSAATVAAVIGGVGIWRAQQASKLAQRADARAEAAENRAIRIERRGTHQELTGPKRGFVRWTALSVFHGRTIDKGPYRAVELTNLGADAAERVKVFLDHPPFDRIEFSQDKVESGSPINISLEEFDFGGPGEWLRPKAYKKFDVYLPSTEFDVTVLWRNANGTWSEFETSVAVPLVAWRAGVTQVGEKDQMH